ncbi:histidine phosphatase family protein [Crocosphaera chwakensis]|uniref:Phosphoglycerate/bisphosphoglycerate mutase n=1 Tax=Crocosphaera chwakensis CCY0110 TaxID=391612 RepID=A3ISF4_9CHRO|nr:histidine phosphatase family protein [Crocosphaera chwakensis]EAZ90524.1 Phosphoglycerate/bisphosphoglycerate mutase [Crocosphaera chwakensis CCY0110]
MSACQTVWIARHGNRLDFVKPDWFNTAQRRYDPPLSEDGFIQAKQLGQRLQYEKIGHIFASPFLRTIQTASEVAKLLDIPIKLEAGIGEWHNPQWMSETPEIHPRELLEKDYSYIDWNYTSYRVPKYPEMEVTMMTRMAEVIEQLVSQYSDDILLVGHGASVMGLIQGLTQELPVFQPSLCCLSKLVKTDSKWEIEIGGDTSHLSETEKEVRLV